MLNLYTQIAHLSIYDHLQKKITLSSLKTKRNHTTLDLFELVSIVEQQNISAETLVAINCSEFHDASSKPPFRPPKGEGESFPGGVSRWSAFFPFVSVTHVIMFYQATTAAHNTNKKTKELNKLPSSRPWKKLFKCTFIDINSFCIIKDQLASSPLLALGSKARKWANF